MSVKTTSSKAASHEWGLFSFAFDLKTVIGWIIKKSIHARRKKGDGKVYETVARIRRSFKWIWFSYDRFILDPKDDEKKVAWRTQKRKKEEKENEAKKTSLAWSFSKRRDWERKLIFRRSIRGTRWSLLQLRKRLISRPSKGQGTQHIWFTKLWTAKIVCWCLRDGPDLRISAQCGRNQTL